MKMTEIPEHLKQMAERAAKMARGEPVEDMEIPEHLMKPVAKIPAHLLARAKAMKEQVTPRSNYLHVHDKEECKHGFRGKWCRCPDMSGHRIIPCSQTKCIVKDESVVEAQSGIIMNDALNVAWLQEKAELEDKLFSACLALLANDIEVPAKIRPWFSEYNKLRAKL